MKYFTKLSDLTYYGKGAKNNPKAKITSVGMFVSDSDYLGSVDHKSRGEHLRRILDSTPRRHVDEIPNIRKAYLKKFPGDYTRVVTKYEVAPLFGRKAKQRFKEVSKKPTFFFRWGPRGGYDRYALESEVLHGIPYEEFRELVKKRER